MPLNASLLPDRGVIYIKGEDAGSFLNGLVTANVGHLDDGEARFAAILTPQGKILCDFFVIGVEGGLILDAPRALVPDVIQRLTFYRLRAKVEILDLSRHYAVAALWGAGDAPDTLDTFPDPRLPALGLRAIFDAGDALEQAGCTIQDSDAYHTHRVSLGVPQGGMDFIYSDIFPHDVDMDLLGGIDFKKGCYVGQEVVSRMQHRGLARKRIVTVSLEDAIPPEGAAILADTQAIGHLGSVYGGTGIALIRLDKLEEALASGARITAGGVPAVAYKQGWMSFDMPVKA